MQPGGSFDRVCIGEGEDCLSELCHAIDAGQPTTGIAGFLDVIDSAVVRNNARAELVDMNELPPIDRSIYDKFAFFRRSPYLRVYGGRGCPFRCSFCANTQMTDIYG